MHVYGIGCSLFVLPCQSECHVLGLPCRQILWKCTLICASSSTSSISYLREMICWTRCRHSSQNIPRLTSAHWASHQATGRMSHCGAPDDEDRDCRKKKRWGGLYPPHQLASEIIFAVKRRKDLPPHQLIPFASLDFIPLIYIQTLK